MQTGTGSLAAISLPILRLAPAAKVNDGRLDVVVIDRTTKAQFLWHWLRSLLPGHHHLRGTRRYRAREVTVQSPIRLFAHADSYLLDGTPLTCRVRPAALQVYAGFPNGGEESAFIDDHPRPRIRLPLRRRGAR